MATILDGRVLSRELSQALRPRIAALPRPPGLAVVRVGEDPASEVYVGKKTERADQEALKATGMQFVRLPAADAAAWKGKVPDFLGAWVNELKQKGFGPQAEQVAQQVRAILSK